MDMSLEDGLRFLLRRFHQDVSRPAFVSFTRLLIGEAMRKPEYARVLSEVMVERMFAMMTAFFAMHVERGDLRNVDPTVTAMRFVGSTLSILMLREVLDIPAIRALDPEAMERDMVDDFLRGVLP